ncbi:MAG TPA: histidine kinase [Chloroflexaceae bacterium]|nr:histidine kinase [Chloroflexaceae bacterium]
MPPWRRRLTVGASLLALAFALGPVGLALAGCAHSPLITPSGLALNLAAGLAFVLLGGLITRYQPANRIGWLCLWAGAGNAFFIGGALIAIPCALAGQLALPGLAELAWLIYSVDLGFAIVPVFILLPMLFPSGSFLSPAWRRLGLGGAGLVMFACMALGLLPDFRRINAVGLSFPLDNPFGSPALPGWWHPLFRSVALLGTIGLGLLGVVAMGLRLRRARGDERQQLKWLTYFLATAVSFQLLVFELPGAFFFPQLFQTIWYELIIAVVLFGYPLTIGLAIFKYRLYAIDLVINRTLVYGGLTLMVVLFYTLTVGLLSLLFHSTGGLLSSLVATGVVAVLFQPVRERLQRGVDRLLFGERDDPYAVLTQLSRRLQVIAAPDETLTTIVTTVAAALKLPAVVIELTERDWVIGRAAAGGPPGDGLTLPLRYQGELVGRLSVAPRAPGEAFTEPELKLLADIAGQIGPVASATRLTLALQRSREQLVLAREEERRRIRRDLHDGLGPTLASQTLKLDALHDQLSAEQPAAAAQIERLRDQTEQMVGEIRRLVYELRPPALDELGLCGALQSHLAQMQGGRGRLQIALATEPERFPPLPAAIEVAAYRIVLEAVTNVLRHAGATRCRVQLSVSASDGAPCLQICVSDDGVGLPAPPHAGVGLASMRERAEELGGVCTIETGGGGSRVVARLPLPQELHP